MYHNLKGLLLRFQIRVSGKKYHYKLYLRQLDSTLHDLVGVVQTSAKQDSLTFLDKQAAAAAAVAAVAAAGQLWQHQYHHQHQHRQQRSRSNSSNRSWNRRRSKSSRGSDGFSGSGSAARSRRRRNNRCSRSSKSSSLNSILVLDTGAGAVAQAIVFGDAFSRLNV